MRYKYAVLKSKIDVFTQEKYKYRISNLRFPLLLFVLHPSNTYLVYLFVL